MPEPKRTERSEQRGLGTDGAALHVTVGSVLKIRSFWMLAIGFVFFCVVANAHDFWLPRYYVEEFGMSNEASGQFATIWNRPATILGLLVGGFLADRLARRRRSGRALVQVLGIAIWVPALYLLGNTASQKLLAGVMVAYGLGFGFYVANLWTTTFEVIDPAARSTAIGYLNVIGIAAAPTTTVIGYLVDEQILSLGQAISGLSLVAVVIVIVLAINAVTFLRHDYHGPLAADSSLAHQR
jgi:sugar phosphate permease